MAGCISRCAVGGVRYQRIIAGSCNNSHVRHFFHVQKVVVFAVAQAFGKDTGHFACLKAHAVAYKQNYVFGFFPGFGIGNSVIYNIFIAAAYSFYFNSACFGKGNIRNAVNGYAVSSFNFAFFAKIFFGVNAVNSYFKIISKPFNFYLQIKALAF